MSDGKNGKWAVIGGSGLYQFSALTVLKKQNIETPYGDPSDAITVGNLNDQDVLFLPRHGSTHHLPPHKVNYRANLYALKFLGATNVIAVNAVGGIDPALSPGDIVIPDQLIDYSYCREHTFSDGSQADSEVQHIDFSNPFSPALRQKIITAAGTVGLPLVQQGVYAVTQGPRLETAAEIRKLGAEGCTIVGMTAMPEAGLAKELDVDYASVAIVANPAAGLSDQPLTVEDIHQVVANGVEKIQKLIEAVVTP